MFHQLSVSLKKPSSKHLYNQLMQPDAGHWYLILFVLFTEPNNIIYSQRLKKIVNMLCLPTIDMQTYIYALAAVSDQGCSALDQGCSALRIDSDWPGALPQVLQLLRRLADALLEAALHHRQHRVVQEGGVLHDEGLLLRVLLAAEAVVHVLHRHQDDFPQALQKHHVQLREVELDALLQEAHQLLGEGHHGVAQVHPAVLTSVLLEGAHAAAAHFILQWRKRGRAAG